MDDVASLARTEQKFKKEFFSVMRTLGNYEHFLSEAKKDPSEDNKDKARTAFKLVKDLLEDKSLHDDVRFLIMQQLILLREPDNASAKNAFYDILTEHKMRTTADRYKKLPDLQSSLHKSVIAEVSPRSEGSSPREKDSPRSGFLNKMINMFSPRRKSERPAVSDEDSTESVGVRLD